MMLHKIKWLFLVALVFTWFAGSAASLAREMPCGKWWRMPRVGEKLALKDEEKKALDDLFYKSRRALIDLKATIEKEQLELDILLDKEPLDEAVLTAHFDKLQEARTKLSAERFQFLIGVRKILGYERYQTLKTTFRAFKEMRHRAKGRQFGRRMPGRESDPLMEKEDLPK